MKDPRATRGFLLTIIGMKPNQKFRSILIVVTALWAMLATGCNTVNGAGKDIEKAGEKIQDSSGK